MSAERNKKLMQEIFEGIARGDGTLFYRHLADDAIMTVTGQYSWSRTFKGKGSIQRDLFGHVRSCLSVGPRSIAYNFIADGEWVVVEARGDMVTKAGQPYRNDYCLLYRWVDGMIVEMKEYQDSTLCERLLGPFPEPGPQASAES